MKILLRSLRIPVFILMGIIFSGIITLIILNNKTIVISNNFIDRVFSLYNSDISIKAENATLSFNKANIYLRVESVVVYKENKLINLKNLSINLNILDLNGNIDTKIINFNLTQGLSSGSNGIINYINCNGSVNGKFTILGFQSGNINLLSDKGWYDPKIEGEEKIKLNHFLFSAQLSKDILTINKLTLEYENGSKAFITQPALLNFYRNSFKSANVQAEILQLPSEILKALWPSNLLPEARGWVVSNIKKGMIKGAKINLNLKEDDLVSLTNKESINLVLNLEDVELKYMDDYQAISNIDGILTINTEGIYLKGKTGKASPFNLEDIDLAILFTDWSLALKTKLSGKISEFSQFISKEALDDLSSYNINFSQIKGVASGELTLALPLDKEDINRKDINLNIKTKINNVVLDKTGFICFKEGSFEVLNEPQKMIFKLSGEKFLNLEFYLHHDESRSNEDKIDIEMEIMTKDKISFEDQIFINNGVIRPKISFINKKWFAEIDLKDAEIDFVPINYINQISSSFLIQCSGSFEDKNLIHSEDCKIVGKKAQGNIFFIYSIADKKFNKLSLNDMKLGENNFTFEVNYQKDASNYNLNASYLDLSNIILDSFVSNKKPIENYNISLKANKILMSNKNYLSNVISKISRSGKKPINIDFRAFANTKDEKIVITKIRKGTQDGYMLYASPAGVFTQNFGIYNNIKKGDLSIEVFPKIIDNNISYEGEIRLNKFSLTNTSAFTKIVMGILSPLNSPQAIADTLRSGSLQVDSLHADIKFYQGVLTISNGVMKASSYDIKFEGSVNLNDKTIDVKGLYIPSAYGINTLISNLPILGRLLSGGKNSAFIGSNFTVSGELKNTKISFNPLTSLTPGFLRNLFN